MKAVRIHSYGHSDQMKVEDISTPKPKDDEVLVKVMDVGVNPVDWKIREGYLKDFIPVKFPFILGQDFSGEVIEVGQDVRRFKAKDPVFGFAIGAYAEYALVSPKAIAHKPHLIDYAQAAAIPTAGLTAWQMVIDVAQVTKGQRLLIHGGGGGVGSFAVQIAVWYGAHVSTTASQADFSYLKELGVDQIIDYKTEKFEEKVSKCDVVIDLVGGDILKRSYPLVKVGGILITTVDSIDQKEIQGRAIRGVEFVMRPDGSELAQLATLINEGVVKPRISKILPITEARKAQDLNQSGQSHGKIVLKVA